MKDVTGLRSSLGKQVAETVKLQSAKIEELEAELAKARKPCLHQISEPEGEYPPLPRRHTYDDEGVELFTLDQMRAYVDADRAMRSQAAPAASSLPCGWSFDVKRSDGRVWLTISTPHGARAALSAAEKTGNGDETIVAQVLGYLADSLATPTAQPAPAAAAVPSDLVTRESAMRAIEHVAIHNSASREREAVEMLASAHATQAAPAAQEADAARYQWLADYLIGDRTDLDDAILACVSEKELSEVIDADRKKGGKP